MKDSANFSVATRLTRLLGETYRSSEAAIKELVDNAWDADATRVTISLPAPLSNDPVVIEDNGAGMTALQLRSEYLYIASDKLARAGRRTTKLNRKIKGRKGIGKFAGLTVASRMQIATVARAQRCTLVIDKRDLMENKNDLESVPLPFGEEPATGATGGTTITLSELEPRLSFPTAERLREVLIYEYGREDQFIVSVNGSALSVQDVPGTTRDAQTTLPTAGDIDLRFTVADGTRTPRSPGIIVKVGGKAVGRPTFFGLDDDEEIPRGLIQRLYGEVEIGGIEDDVTADWSGILENSNAFREAQAYVARQVKEGLSESHKREMGLQRARLGKQIHQRLQKLPEYRRRYAEAALNRILKRFYGESEERIAVVADVALDALEHDEYWAVLDRIGEASKGEVASFAESLEEFGLLQLSAIGQQAVRRLRFLDYFDQLIGDARTREAEVHKALEKNLWMLGRQYSTMSSNKTLRTIIEQFCDSGFSGRRAALRPDLLLSQDYGGSRLLIEFKRPSELLTRDHVAQAEKYRDELGRRLADDAKLDIMLVVGGKDAALDTRFLAPGVAIRAYTSIVSAARSELDWMVRSASGASA